MSKTRQAIDPDKQARILQSAMHQFAQNGYRDTKTDVIAADADVSKGLVFNYFGSKANLYLATVRTTFNKIVGVADLTVWQDADDLKSMLERALRYKIALQLQYPDEFALSMQAYADLGTLPENLRGKVAAIWQDMAASQVPDMLDPVLDRLPLRPGVSKTAVLQLVFMLYNQIGDRAKEMIRQKPDIQIEDFNPLVEDVMVYMDVLENGFLKK